MYPLNLPLVPAPVHTQLRPGRYLLGPEFRIHLRVDAPEHRDLAFQMAERLASRIRAATGHLVPVTFDSSTPPEGASLRIHLSERWRFEDALAGSLDREGEPVPELPMLRPPLDAEGYEISIDPDAAVPIEIEARDALGIGHSLETIRQLLPDRIESASGALPTDGWSLPALHIVDRPRFRWRGLLLDSSRHFLEPSFLHRYLDLLGLHKMNRLHWHLTDDQGWRVEIEAYPRLREVAAWRKGTDGSPYGGSYSQREIRELVSEATARGITVVPEIELPGHARAALAAYPELSCTGGPFEVATEWGIFEDVFCAGRDETFQFLETVLDEVLDLFPSPYIHIGADEVPKTRWENCARCQERLRSEGLAGTDALQSWFVDRIRKFLDAKGRRLVGWDEIHEGGLPESVTVQSWRGFDGAREAARSGRDAIVSPVSHAYFDYGLDKIDLRQVYSFEPVPDGLTPEEEFRILGGECNMWTERAPQETIDSKLFPRILAMAERLWSPRGWTDFDSFRSRVRRYRSRLDALGVTYGAESNEA